MVSKVPSEEALLWSWGLEDILLDGAGLEAAVFLLAFRTSGQLCCIRLLIQRAVGMATG